MRKFFGIMCIIVILMPYFFIPSFEVSSKTLGDLKDELNKSIQDLENNKKDLQTTKSSKIIKTKKI